MAGHHAPLGEPMHADARLLTGLLKSDLGLQARPLRTSGAPPARVSLSAPRPRPILGHSV